MILHDLVSGVFWLGISVFVGVQYVEVGVGTFRSPGPGFMPFLAACFLGILAVILILKSYLSERGLVVGANFWRGTKWKKSLFVFLSLCLYSLFLTRIGYLISTFVLMIYLLGQVEKSRWWIRLIVSLIITSTSYIIFSDWLGVPLPKGITDIW
jgi:putative tricarboxylic transport membrane protein